MTGAIASTSIGHSAIGAGGTPASGSGEVEHHVGGLSATAFGGAKAQLRGQAGGAESSTRFGLLAATATARAGGIQITRFGAPQSAMQVRAAGVAVTRFGGAAANGVHDLSSLGPVARSGFDTAPPLQMVLGQREGEPLCRFGGAGQALRVHSQGLLSTRMGKVNALTIVHAGGSAPMVRFGGSGAAGTLEVEAASLQVTQYGGLALGEVRVQARGMAPGTRFGHLVIQRGQRC